MKEHMLTDADISDLWQFAHLKFHSGENLACKVISSPTPIADRAAPPEMLIAGAVAENTISQESTRKPVDLGTLESSKRDDEEISCLWQFAHLKFHFGEKLALNTTIIPCGATPLEAVAGNDSPQASRKEPASLGIPDSATVIA
jgi:hypothetical protein